MNRRFLFLFVFIFSLNSYANVSCLISQDTNNDGDYETELALYPSLDTRSEFNMSNLIAPNGEVINDFKFYELQTNHAAYLGSKLLEIQYSDKLIFSLSTIIDDRESSLKLEDKVIGTEDKLTVYNIDLGLEIKCLKHDF